MDDPAAEKIARNNATFRRANDEINTAAARYGLDDGRTSPFLCECSDLDCTKIIGLTLAEYRHVRSNPRWFAHAPGHETRVAGAVKLIEQHPSYVLVEKTGRAGSVASQLASEPGDG